MLQAQRGAQLIHQEALVTVLYNLVKTSNTLDLNTVRQNNLENLIVNFQREGSLWTFLMQAAYWNNENLARWLFSQNADPFVRNASNQTALDVAMNERNMNVAEIVRLRMGELEAAKRAVGSARSSKPVDIAANTKADQLH
jgi:ankyrin repeat protein